MTNNKRKFVLIALLLLIVLLICAFSFEGYVYESDIDCVNSQTTFNEPVDSVIYKYENENNEILLYNSENDRVVQCTFAKKKISGKIKYRMKKASTSAPITYHKEWTKVSRNLRYIFVDYEDDIEQIDCGGFEPVGTKIYYSLSDGKEESCWIYVIDETKQ